MNHYERIEIEEQQAAGEEAEARRLTEAAVSAALAALIAARAAFACAIAARAAARRPKE